MTTDMADKEGTEPLDYRCRRCAQRLGISEAVITKFDACPENISAKFSELFLDIERCPYWITREIEKAAYTKGRLSCLKCEGRLGSFDYLKGKNCVCGQHPQPPIHILSGRVDPLPARRASPLDKLIPNTESVIRQRFRLTANHPYQVSLASRDEGLTELSMSALDSNKNTKSVEYIGVNSSVTNAIFKRGEEDATPADNVQLNPQSSPSVSEDEEEKEEELFVEMTNRFSGLKDETDETGDDAAGELLSQVPLVEEVPLDVSCPVCLDLFYRPHRCWPCGHVFCEPCLRRIGQEVRGDTPCPLCRHTIHHCVSMTDLELELIAVYPSAYQQRELQLRKYMRHRFRLPSAAWWNTGTSIMGSSFRTSPQALGRIFRSIVERYVVIFILGVFNWIWSVLTGMNEEGLMSNELQPFSNFLTQLSAKLFLVGTLYMVRQLRYDVLGGSTLKYSLYLFICLVCWGEENWLRFIISIVLLSSLFWL